MMFFLASTLSSGATASSQSKNITSVSDLAAFSSNISGENLARLIQTCEASVLIVQRIKTHFLSIKPKFIKCLFNCCPKIVGARGHRNPSSSLFQIFQKLNPQLRNDRSSMAHSPALGAVSPATYPTTGLLMLSFTQAAASASCGPQFHRSLLPPRFQDHR